MTAPALAPPLYLDRAARPGDRVNCGRAGSWLSLIGTVFAIDEVTGQLRIREEQTGHLVYVQPTSARVFAPRRQFVTCPTCHNEVPGLLATCRKPDCLAESIRADAALDRLEDQ
jgi:hypothetical protein